MRTVILFVSLLLVSACQQNGDLGSDSNPNRPTPITTNPTNPVTPVTTSRIEFRVAGNATSARVRFTNAVDGTTILTTTLPYVVTVSTVESSMFIALEATPLSYPFGNVTPFMAVQIFVNGSLFREAISEDYSYSTLTVSGTWRK